MALGQGYSGNTTPDLENRRWSKRSWSPRGLVTAVRRQLPQGGTLSADSWRSRHRGILALLWLHSLAVPIYGAVQGYSLGHVILESLILPSATSLASLSVLSRRTRTVIASVGLLSASGVLVHLSRGLIEMHFHFFVMVVVVSLYQDWLPFLMAIGYVLVHHGLVGALNPSSVYNHPAAIAQPWKWAAIHALFIAGISVASLVNWRLTEMYLSRRREAERRMELVSDASRQLLSSLDLDSVLGTLGALVVPAIADVCLIDVVDDDGTIRRLPPVAAAPYFDAVRKLLAVPPDPTDEANPVVRAIRSGESQLIQEISDELLDQSINDPAHRQRIQALRPRGRSALVVPVASRHRVFAVMTAGTVEPRVLTADDLALSEEIARRAAAAAENARLYAAQHEAADTLQHSLLPERLPTLPGVELGARYVAGGTEAEVGGDWYDVIPLSDGSIGLVIGDVVGRGIKAASVMGQLRNGLRAYAHDDLSPGEVLTRLNTLLDGLGMSDQMATVCYAVFDVDSGELTLASAGHPPAIVLSADGSSTPVENIGGVPLGVKAATMYSERRLAVAAGDTVLLYTDGLVEDRETPLAEGIERLCDVARHASGDVDAFCEEVLTTVMAGRSIQDDVALLALRYSPFRDRVHVTLPAEPWVLRPLRSALRRWLREAGATEDEAFGVLVATTEACSNVIRHVSHQTKQFVLDANREGDVRIEVRDRGKWRAAPPRRHGGRGLRIIEESVDEFRLVKGPPETVVSMRRSLANARSSS